MACVFVSVDVCSVQTELCVAGGGGRNAVVLQEHPHSPFTILLVD